MPKCLFCICTEEVSAQSRMASNAVKVPVAIQAKKRFQSEHALLDCSHQRSLH